MSSSSLFIILCSFIFTSFSYSFFFFFFFNDTATTEIYTLSLHDALPISFITFALAVFFLLTRGLHLSVEFTGGTVDRKSTRLNSSHTVISYAVFCLKKKKHTSELQSHSDLVCRLLLEKKKQQ